VALALGQLHECLPISPHLFALSHWQGGIDLRSVLVSSPDLGLSGASRALTDLAGNRSRCLIVMALPRWEQMTRISALSLSLSWWQEHQTSPNTLKALEFKTSGLCTLSYFGEGLKRASSDTRHGSSLEKLLWGKEISGLG
jgi:hypothetical protein